jgi:hypothetical protein
MNKIEEITCCLEKLSDLANNTISYPYLAGYFSAVISTMAWDLDDSGRERALESLQNALERARGEYNE